MTIDILAYVFIALTGYGAWCCYAYAWRTVRDNDRAHRPRALMLPPPCESLVPFVDGELSERDAAAFRAHLPDCAPCRRDVTQELQLSMRIDAPRSGQ